MDIRRLILRAVLGGLLLAGAAVPTLAADKGEIVVAEQAIRQQFDPTAMVATPEYVDHEMLYDGLFNLTDKGIVPGLAVSWQISPDGTQIDFKLREGVKFHNGDPFTAEDVKFTFEKLLEADNKHSYRKPFVELLDHVDVLGPNAARFVLKKPWLGFLTASRNSLIGIVPKNYYQQVGAKGFQAKPIGTGPYKLADLKPGEWTRYEANPNYWGGAPKAKAITLKLVKEPFTAYAMLVRGEADIIMGLSGPLLDRARATKGARVFEAKYSGSSVLFFNRTTFPEAQDRRVRLAIAHAIDRKRIATSMLAGICEPGTSFLTPATYGYAPNLKQIEYNPAEAKRLLAEAGLKPGKKITFNTMTESFGSLPNAPQVLEAIAGYLEAVGFVVERKPYDTNAYLQMVRSKQHPDVFYGPTSLPDDGSIILESWFLPTSPFQGGNINEADYVDVFKTQLVETSPDRRLETIRKFTQLEGAKLTAVPLFWCNTPFVAGPRVKQWQPAAFSPYHLNVSKLTPVP